MSKKEPQLIQEFRFRLNLAGLAQEQIAYLPFPWANAVEAFIDFIEQGRGTPIDFSERPPYQTLNAALVALSTNLVHGFEQYEMEDQESRYLIVPADAPRPQLDQLRAIVQPWLAAWIDHTFKQEITLPEVQQRSSGLIRSGPIIPSFIRPFPACWPNIWFSRNYEFLIILRSGV
jgi:hypothetical protein